MSDITLINDSEQSQLITNGLAKNGELYLKKEGSTDAGSIVVYDSGSWRTFANDAAAFSNTYSVEFDGSNDYITTGSNFQSTLNSGFSFSMWGKLSSTGSNQGLMGAENSNYRDRFVCFVDTSNRVGFYYTANNQGVPTIRDTTGTNLTNWFHVVGTVEQDGSNVDLTLYVNGSQKATGSATSTMVNFGTTTTPVDLFLAGRNYNGSLQLPFNGLLDEAALIPSVLSSSDVTTIYNSGVPADISSFNPVGWWRMGDNNSGTGTTITDQGSGTNNGTLTNGPTFSTDIPS